MIRDPVAASRPDLSSIHFELKRLAEFVRLAQQLCLGQADIHIGDFVHFDRFVLTLVKQGFGGHLRARQRKRQLVHFRVTGCPENRAGDDDRFSWTRHLKFIDRQSVWIESMDHPPIRVPVMLDVTQNLHAPISQVSLLNVDSGDTCRVLDQRNGAPNAARYQAWTPIPAEHILGLAHERSFIEVTNVGCDSFLLEVDFSTLLADFYCRFEVYPEGVFAQLELIRYINL